MRRYGVALVLAFLVVLSMSICQAEERKDEWKNPDFNFRTVKTIVVNTAIDPNAEVDKFNVRKLETFYLNAFYQTNKRWSQNNFRFITLHQMEDAISNVTGVNMRQLGIDDPIHYKSEIDRFTPIMADAILNIQVISFGYEQRFVPKSSYTYIEQVETEIESSYQDSSGRWVQGKTKIKQPVKRTRTTPDHYDTYANVGMEYELLDTKTNEPIWMLLDVREAFGKDPIDMAERIVNRAGDCLATL